MGMTYKKLETISIAGTLAALAAAALVGPLLGWFYPPAEQWKTLIAAAKYIAAFLVGVSIGAALVEVEKK
jgi:hypothetical protein